MTEIVQLARDEEVASRPFSARVHTTRDAVVMQAMLGRMRTLAAGWTDAVHTREPDADGRRHWIRVPDVDALLSARNLTVVGFFGQARPEVDHSLIHALEVSIVDTLERLTGVLSYYDLALPTGGFGNLILCRDPAAPVSVHGHELHRRAVELTPRHYRTVRLHTGTVPGPFSSAADLIVECTRYYDFAGEPAWLAVRELGSIR